MLNYTLIACMNWTNKLIIQYLPPNMNQPLSSASIDGKS